METKIQPSNYQHLSMKERESIDACSQERRKKVGEIRVTVSAVVKSDTYMLICAYMMHVNKILSLCWKHVCASFTCEVYVVI